MNTKELQISACRLDIPVFSFVGVKNIYPADRRAKILSSFTLGELENKVTNESVKVALTNADN